MRDPVLPTKRSCFLSPVWCERSLPSCWVWFSTTSFLASSLPKPGIIDALHRHLELPHGSGVAVPEAVEGEGLGCLFRSAGMAARQGRIVSPPERACPQQCSEWSTHMMLSTHRTQKSSPGNLFWLSTSNHVTAHSVFVKSRLGATHGVKKAWLFMGVQLP